MNQIVQFPPNMASEKVYVCGRCSDYGAPNLEDLVTHMSNCGVPDIRKKGNCIYTIMKNLIVKYKVII